MRDLFLSEIGDPNSGGNRASIGRVGLRELPVGYAMRLRKSWQFRKVYDNGEKTVCDNAVIFYCKNPGGAGEPCGEPLFGVVASKRVGNAVKRNRAKRLLRETIRHFSGKLNHRDIWVVLVAKSNILGRSSSEVQSDIGRALERARLITGSNN